MALSTSTLLINNELNNQNLTEAKVAETADDGVWGLYYSTFR